jgi:hypothetical protein
MICFRRVEVEEAKQVYAPSRQNLSFRILILALTIKISRYVHFSKTFSLYEVSIKLNILYFFY